MRRVNHRLYQYKTQQRMRRVLSWILLIPSYQAVISDPLAPVSLVWSGHPLAKINIAQNKGVASKEGRDLPTMQSARRQLTCVLICFCVHLSFNSLYPLFSAFRIGFKSEIISVILTFLAASFSSNILSHQIYIPPGSFLQVCSSL